MKYLILSLILIGVNSEAAKLAAIGTNSTLVATKSAADSELAARSARDATLLSAIPANLKAKVNKKIPSTLYPSNPTISGYWLHTCGEWSNGTDSQGHVYRYCSKICHDWIDEK